MIGHLQQLHMKYKGKGLVLLGIDCVDSKADASAFLRSHGVTFANILDTSEEARKIVGQEYQKPGGGAVPLDYIIGRDGKIVTGWYGDQSAEGEKTLAGLGIK